jgi:hypothetical protein
MRTVRVIFLVVLTGLLATPGISAQGASPGGAGSILGSLGYPEFVVEVNGDAFRLEQTTIPAGRTMIVLRNTHVEESWHGFLLRLPDDVSLDALLAATPASGEEDAPPEWLFRATYPGFPGETLAGQENRVVVDLTPGEYLIVGDTFQPFDVTPVTAATPQSAALVQSDASVSLIDFAFNFPSDLVPGQQVWEVTNTGDQPHEILLARSSVPITAEQALALIEGDENATPAPGSPTMADIVPVGGIGWLSPGATGWTEVTLEPGYYIALCFVPDPATFTPHAMMGMVTVFEVK